MVIQRLYYEELFTIVNFKKNLKIGAEAAVAEGEDPTKALDELKYFVRREGQKAGMDADAA